VNGNGDQDLEDVGRGCKTIGQFKTLFLEGKREGYY
jgi:hypothetical protein